MNILQIYLLIGLVFYLMAAISNKTLRERWHTGTISSLLAAIVFIFVWIIFPVGAFIKRIRGRNERNQSSL